MIPRHENLGSDLTARVIGAAMTVHRELGPGLDEKDYEQAIHLEFLAAGIEHECQVALPLMYKGAQLDCGYRMDVVVENEVLLELKALEKLHPLHEAQLMTYLRLSKLKLGLLMNFGNLMLRDGIARRANSTVNVSNPRSPSANHPAMDEVSHQVIGAALEVQHILGQGLLRSAYEAALAHEIRLRGLKVEQRVPTTLVYREQRILSSKEIPLLVEGSLMVTCLCVKKLEPVHLAQQRSLLKAAHIERGLCLNFHAESIATEIKRILKAPSEGPNDDR